MSSTIKYKESLDLLLAFCDYRERCTSEVREKMRALKLDEEVKDRLLEDLKELGVFDDKRYIEAFINGKVRIKRWGKNKIKAALSAKRLVEEDIKIGLEEYIDEELYTEHLNHFFNRKWDQLKNGKDYSTRQKLFRFLYSKGYESDLINDVFKENFKN